jgi:hypothetical protein
LVVIQEFLLEGLGLRYFLSVVVRFCIFRG